MADELASVSGEVANSTATTSTATQEETTSNIEIGTGQDKFTLKPETGGETGADKVATDNATQSEDTAKKPTQTPEQNKAFAQLRREKEALERKLQQYNQTVAEKFGSTHGLNDLDSYFNAVNQTLAQQQAQQQQQMDDFRRQREQQLRDAGYNPDEIRDIFRTDPMFIQMQQENNAMKNQLKQVEQQRQQQQLVQHIHSDHDKLRKKYGDLIPKDLSELDDGTKELMVKYNMPLSAAWKEANEDRILEWAANNAKAKTVKNIASKDHLNTEKPDSGGNFAENIELSAEQIRVYKSLFPGKKMSDYKKMAAKYSKK